MKLRNITNGTLTINGKDIPSGGTVRLSYSEFISSDTSGFVKSVSNKAVLNTLSKITVKELKSIALNKFKFKFKASTHKDDIVKKVAKLFNYNIMEVNYECKKH